MSYNILYIEDEYAASIKSDIESNGVNVTVLQPSGFEADLANIYQEGYDAYLMDFRLTSGKGKVDAPTFATTLRTDGDNQRKVPIIMISTEKNLPHFENDFTSQDLFDVVIGKEAFRKEHQKYTNRIKTIIDAYRNIQVSEFKVLNILQIDTADKLDYRFLSLLERFASRKDVYGYLRSISNSLLRAIGPLVESDVLAARLGIDITCDDFQKLLYTTEFTRCKYTGVLSQTYERWWFDKIQQLWGTLTDSSMRRTSAQVRVDILNKKFGLNLKAAIPLDMATSSTFWTICHENKKPLDPSDGFQYRNRHIDEWLEPEYISLISALEHPTQQEYLSPRDKEEVRFLEVKQMRYETQILRDIESLAKLLNRYQIESDNLYLLEEMASNYKAWDKCDIKDLTFTFSCASQKPYPDIVKKISVAIDLSYTYDDLNSNRDVFKSYQLEICIKGYERDAKVESKYFCWHLDRETNVNGKFIHPRYHFHAGGYLMKDVLPEDGIDFVISSPRLSHPPMDLVLVIHFMIQNFINTRDEAEKYKITSDVEYIEILSRAHKRVLDPYFNTFSKDFEHQDYTKTNLFPLYS